MTYTSEENIISVPAANSQVLEYSGKTTIDSSINDSQSVPNLSFFSWRRNIKNILSKDNKILLAVKILSNFFSIGLGVLLPIAWMHTNSIYWLLCLVFAIFIIISFFYIWKNDAVFTEFLQSMLNDMSKFKLPEEIKDDD